MPTTPRRSRALCWLTVLMVAGLALPAAAAQAALRPEFQMPFACGEVWDGSTFSSHSPSILAIDWNRDAYDEGHLVVASAPGVVTSVVDLGDTSYGLYVVIDHGGGWTTLHAHLDAAFVVEGQRVDQGQPIALLGNSGGSTGAHLHYEQRLDRVDQRGHFDDTRFVYDSWLRSRNCADVPVVGDWDGDHVSDVGVFRRGHAGGRFRERLPSGAQDHRRLGLATDQPVTGDWNGDGRTDVGVWRTESRTFTLAVAGAAKQSVRFGSVGDVAIAGDWDGDGRTDVGVFRPATATFRLRAADGSVSRTSFGTSSSLPIAGDWDGDGRWQVGVYDPATSTFSLSLDGGGIRTVVYGVPSSLPAVGSWNSDATTDLGTWNPATGTFRERFGPRHTEMVRFGRIR